MASRCHTVGGIGTALRRNDRVALGFGGPGLGSMPTRTPARRCRGALKHVSAGRLPSGHDRRVAEPVAGLPIVNGASYSATAVTLHREPVEAHDASEEGAERSLDVRPSSRSAPLQDGRRPCHVGVRVRVEAVVVRRVASRDHGRRDAIADCRSPGSHRRARPASAAFCAWFGFDVRVHQVDCEGGDRQQQPRTIVIQTMTKPRSSSRARRTTEADVASAVGRLELERRVRR